MTLKEIIKDYRDEHGLSQREFSVKCGLSNAAISNIEKGKVNPNTGKETVTSIETLMKIASGMGITLDELFAKMDNNIPLRMSITEMRQPFHPSVVEILDNKLKSVQSEKQPDDDQDEPKTDDIRLLIRGLNKLSPEQVAQAKNVFRAMFAITNPNLFDEGDDDNGAKL